MQASPDLHMVGTHRVAQPRGTSNRSGRAIKGCERAVTGGLDEPAAPPLDLSPRDLIMSIEKATPRGVTQLGGMLGRTAHVATVDSSENSVTAVGRSAHSYEL